MFYNIWKKIREGYYIPLKPLRLRCHSCSLLGIIMFAGEILFSWLKFINYQVVRVLFAANCFIGMHDLHFEIIYSQTT